MCVYICVLIVHFHFDMFSLVKCIFLLIKCIIMLIVLTIFLVMKFCCQLNHIVSYRRSFVFIIIIKMYSPVLQKVNRKYVFS